MAVYAVEKITEAETKWTKIGGTLEYRVIAQAPTPVAGWGIIIQERRAISDPGKTWYEVGRLCPAPSHWGGKAYHMYVKLRRFDTEEKARKHANWEWSGEVKALKGSNR